MLIAFRNTEFVFRGALCEAKGNMFYISINKIFSYSNYSVSIHKIIKSLGNIFYVLMHYFKY